MSFEPSPLNFPDSGFFSDSQTSVFLGFLTGGRACLFAAGAWFNAIQTSDIELLAKRSLLSVRFPQSSLGEREFAEAFEITGDILVGAPGFEPGTSCAQGRRATRLRYAPTVSHPDSSVLSNGAST
jgi:hypothetical protein